MSNINQLLPVIGAVAMIQPMTYTMVAADDSNGTKTLKTKFNKVNHVFAVQVLRAGNVVTSDVDVTISGGNIVVADGSSYALTSGDIFSCLAVGEGGA